MQSFNEIYKINSLSSLVSATWDSSQTAVEGMNEVAWADDFKFFLKNQILISQFSVAIVFLLFAPVTITLGWRFIIFNSRAKKTRQQVVQALLSSCFHVQLTCEVLRHPASEFRGPTATVGLLLNAVTWISCVIQLRMSSQWVSWSVFQYTSAQDTHVLQKCVFFSLCLSIGMLWVTCLSLAQFYAICTVKIEIHPI